MVTSEKPKLTIDQSLGHPGELLAVWGLSCKEEYLCVYTITDGKLEFLAGSPMSTTERELRTAELAQRRIRVGASDMPGPFVWSTARGLSVWSLIRPVGVVAESDAETIRTRNGGEAHHDDIVGVLSFFDEDSPGHRGVKVVTRSGVEIAIAEEDSLAARLDPTYGMDHVMMEGAWATFLGRDLAVWLSVPHTDQLP